MQIRDYVERVCARFVRDLRNSKILRISTVLFATGLVVFAFKIQFGGIMMVAAFFMYLWYREKKGDRFEV